MSSVVCWWSGGVTSAVAGNLAQSLFGDVQFVFIDTKNEHDDTYRFKDDCEQWYGKKIKTISAIPDKFATIQDVWFKYTSLNVAAGAVCSAKLKRAVRKNWQSKNDYDYQVFGFDISEARRALGIKKNYPEAKPIFPLLMYGMKKQDCINKLEESGITIPLPYSLGFPNNNCLKTGCVQGGVGYWRKIQNEYPDKFDAMAAIEHELTNRAGKPVTILKDQSKNAVKLGHWQVFLKLHPDYPMNKCIDDMKSRGELSILECNGFCGMDDLSDNKNEAFDELNTGMLF